ncbi:putative bifunctional diguanylate cyclase/phosphodiesterase [Kaarinaea lacus]
MNLRLRLLLIFALGELFVLMFFGYIAYDTAKLTNLNNEITLLSSVTPRIADDITHDLNEGTTWSSTLLPEEHDSNDDAIYLFVSDHQGNLVSFVDEPVIKHVYQQVTEYSSRSSASRSGSLSVSGSTFVWARSDVPDYGYQLTVIRQAHVSRANIFFKEMGVSLIVAAVIMLWVASWAAMYVSMLIEKLDEQKNILKHRSLHDVLTGLPNRALLNDRLQQLISLNDRLPMQFAICFIDLNRFKDVNDTLGHHVGDELLLEISKRLKSNLRKYDTVARMGGDEFALILRNIKPEKARLIAEKILKEIEVPIEAGGHKLFVSGSMGIAMFPGHGDDVQMLLKKADVAMYAAKRAGTFLEFYADTHEVFTRDKLSLTHDLREAIGRDQLELYYQPKYDIEAQKVVGVEALLRWEHPKIGYIQPQTFIQLAEHSGLINALSKWVVQRAFSDSIELDRNGIDISLSINLSAHYLQDPKFESDIGELLEQSYVDASKIILELTESAMFINSAKTKELFRRLTGMGFRISVDDFGTGYSTLTNLRRFPISELKIDRSFVDNIATDVEDASIVDAMIGLGASLDIDVVAEGVETLEVLEILKKSGCYTIQGDLISKAVPLNDFMEWVESEGSGNLRLASI